MPVHKYEMVVKQTNKGNNDMLKGYFSLKPYFLNCSAHLQPRICLQIKHKSDW